MEQLLTLNVPINGRAIICFQAQRSIIIWSATGQELYDVLLMRKAPRTAVKVLLARPPVRACGAYIVNLDERRVVVSFYGSSLSWSGSATDLLRRIKGDQTE